MPTFSWNTFEYEDKERSPDWFWAVGIVALSLAVIAVLYDNILFGLFVIIGTFTLLLFAHRKPRPVAIEINDRGIRINDEVMPWKTLESFAIHEIRGRKILALDSLRTFAPIINVPVAENIETERLHDFMLRFIPEGEHTPSLAEAFMDYLGF